MIIRFERLAIGSFPGVRNCHRRIQEVVHGGALSNRAHHRAPYFAVVDLGEHRMDGRVPSRGIDAFENTCLGIDRRPRHPAARGIDRRDEPVHAPVELELTTFHGHAVKAITAVALAWALGACGAAPPTATSSEAPAEETRDAGGPEESAVYLPPSDDPHAPPNAHPFALTAVVAGYLIGDVGPECTWRPRITVDGWELTSDETSPLLAPVITASEGAWLVWVEACGPDPGAAVELGGWLAGALSRRVGVDDYIYTIARTCETPRIDVHVLTCPG